VPSSPSNGVIAYSHLEIDATGAHRPLAILFGDSARRTRRPAALRVFPGNTIVLRPAGKAWYHDGVPGLGTSIEETAASLRQIVAALHPSQVITIGAAMGGYAAVAFGCLLQVDRIIALSAEIQLMLPGSRSAKELAAPPRKFGDLLPHLHDRKPGSVWLVASEAEIFELHGAARAASLPSVHAVALRNTPYLTIKSLDSDEVEALLAGAAMTRAIMPTMAGAGDLLDDRLAIDSGYEAYTLLLEKRGAEAERHAAQAVDRRPDWPLAQSLLGRALAMQGRDTEAEAAATRAVALDPTQAAFHHHHGLALARLGRFAEAAHAQRMAIELGHGGPWAYHQLGVALQRAGDLAGAETAHRAASEKRPKSALFQHHLAVVLTALGRVAEAELSARTAVALDEQNGDYMRQLARILRAQGRAEDADEMLAKADSVDRAGHQGAEQTDPAQAAETAAPPIEIPASVAEILSRVPRA
jgi:Flp pilus assembly protein TadD